MDSFSLEFLAAALGIGEKGVATVDDDIAFFEKRRELTNDRVHRPAGFDHDLRLSRLLERADEFFHRTRWLNIFSLWATGGEFVRDFGSAIEYMDLYTLRFHVEDEVRD